MKLTLKNSCYSVINIKINKKKREDIRTIFLFIWRNCKTEIYPNKQNNERVMTFHVKFVFIFSIIIYYLQTNRWKYLKRSLLPARNWWCCQKRRLQLPGQISTSHCKTASGTYFHLIWRRHVSTVTAVGRSGTPSSALELVPKIFDMVKFCALRSSVQSLNLIVVIQSHDCPRNMTDDIVILIATCVQHVKLL